MLPYGFLFRTRTWVRWFLVFFCLQYVVVLAAASSDSSPARWGSYDFSRLFQPDSLPEGKCNKDTPCETEACCNGSNCGFSPEHCGDDCISQCDAKPECGKYADPPGKECPINVCCSEHGFCGTTEEFCNSKCQSNCDQPGSTSPWKSDVREMVIGYVEAWAFSKDGCGKRQLDAIRVDSLTHLFASFGYINPGTYEIYPMPDVDIKDLKAITDLKQKAPGIRVWLALGGWTFSDDGTDTQPVFGDLSSTPSKRKKFIDQLEKFMLQWGFDGVDFDWEYPGAKDRGGHSDDGVNYVALVDDVRRRFENSRRGWGVSFTAPSSYWYLRHFQIEKMMKYVDFVNLMTYDLHGSWDKDSDFIGPIIHSHTNLTEIKQSLDLLWRNNVPANQVNLGLGFYGRTYKLKDKDCYKPGCKFKEAGKAGTCSGQDGYMSYQDIAGYLEGGNVEEIHDAKTATNYFVYNGDQWVSYDDVETIKEKVAFANKQGLRGLFIWAVTQDNHKNDLLDAVLYPEGLGKFKDRNGAANDGNDWTTVEPGNCVWSDCDDSCPGPYVEITEVRCRAGSDGQKKFCCPLASAPDPDECRWSAHAIPIFGLCNFAGGRQCNGDEVEMTTNKWYIDEDGDDEFCAYSDASLCCKEERPSLCKWEDTCVDIDGDGKPKGDACPSGKKFTTYRAGHCSHFKDSYQPFCCDENIEPQCHWKGELKDDCQPSCGSDESEFGAHDYGGGRNCIYQGQGRFPETVDKPRLLCCNTEAMRVKLKTLPVPLENLFPEPGEQNDEPEFKIEVDADSGEDLHPNEHSFGWYIMSGPKEELTTLNKRDGSDWELFGCDTEKHDGVQSALMVCGKEDGHNCDTIFDGGAADTVVEMPHECGPGKYAMVVSIEPHEDKIVPRHLEGRIPQSSTIYNLTFDYGFHRLSKRGKSDVLFRVDYSDSPDYWKEVVAAAPDKKDGKRRRDMDTVHEIVKRNHKGSYKRYLDHEWKTEKRSTLTDDLHILHKRWFSAWTADKVAETKDWIHKQGDVNLEHDILEHSVDKTFQYDLFNEERSCTVGGIPTHVRAHIYAIIQANIQTPAVLSLIGNLGDLRTFDQSHIMFRNKGSIDAALVFNAFAELRLPHYEHTLFGVAPLGASFKVPGIITVGPEFKVIGSMDGRMSLHANARVDYQVAKWDYSQVYPYVDDSPINDKENPENASFGQTDEEGGSSKPTFGYDIGVSGELEIHVTPMITFGVVFDSKYEIPNAAVDFAVDTYAKMYGSVGSNTDEALKYCYGVEAGYEMFARVSAPTLFGVNLNNKWNLASGEVDAVPQTCGSSSDETPKIMDRNGSWGEEW